MRLNNAKWSDGGATLYFTPPPSVAGLTIRSYGYYYVCERADSSPYSEGVVDNQSSDTPMSGVYLPFGKTCTYQVRAQTDAGYSAWSNAIAAATTLQAPVLNNAKWSDGGATLYFTPPPSVAGLTIRSYGYHYACDNADGSLHSEGLVRSASSDSPLTGVYLPAGKTCAYQIFAETDPGDSQMSNALIVTET